MHYQNEMTKRLMNFWLILLSITVIGCITLYNASQVTWADSHSIIAPKVVKNYNHEVTEKGDFCVVNWDNDHINSTAYEATNFENLPKDFPDPVHVEPVYRNPTLVLNPEKFIMPLLQNGPNNQLVGFREAIFVAVKLNRTIVLPKFIKHHTDNRTIPYVSPVHRLQVSDICKFVSCITFEKFRQTCGYMIDAVLHIRNYKLAKRRGYEKFLGMKLRELPRNQKDDPDVLLVPSTPIPNGGGSLHFHGPDVVKLFTTNAKCVIYPRPLYNLHLPPLKKLKFGEHDGFVEKMKDLELLADGKLFFSISIHTKSPDYIQMLAKEFFTTVMKGRPFLSLHWRYQADEFMHRCDPGLSMENRIKRKICENAMLITAEDIAFSIEQKISDIRNREKTFNIRDIYIATPPSERKMLSGIAKILLDKHGWLTYSSLDLAEYFEVKLKSCGKLLQHYNDIMSTTEMEMCALGVAFLKSQRSSWSDVVAISRKSSKYSHVKHEYDGDIFFMALEQIEKRNKEQNRK